MKIPTDILDVLRRVQTDGRHLRIPGPRLAPRLYERTNEVLAGAGGDWSTREQAHVFPGDAAEAVAQLLQTREVTTAREHRQASQYFPTPPEVVDQLLKLGDLFPGAEVLEPSAGRGAIACALDSIGCLVDCVERDPDNARELDETGAARKLTVADFLTVEPSAVYDRVLMNPPFTRDADIAHVTHALKFLKPGGLLVAVMSQGVAWHKGKAPAFRKLVADRGGTVHPLPESAFKASGTDTATLIVAIPQQRPAGPLSPLRWPTEQSPVRSPEPDAEVLEPPGVIAIKIYQNLTEAAQIMRDLAGDLGVDLDALEQPAGRPAAEPGQPHPEQPLDLGAVE
ncbi:class I SAM-dependent methyltransferase [Streptomyces mirabilis]|uniref:class I SAM-dependent methyltransferase n=1 Tax=Streptomyces mirabilis TaxID=68239 RepID=UPI0033D9C6A9